MRRRMHTRGTAVLDRIHKLFEAHLVPELQGFGALVQRHNAVPWIANKSELEIGFELPAPGFSSALFRLQQIKSSHDAVLSSTEFGPGCFHELFDLPQIQVRLPCLPKNCPNAGRASLGHLYEDAFMFM